MENTKWKGYYICGQGKSNLELEIVKEKNQIVAYFTFNFNNSKKGKYSLIGSYSERDRKLILKPEKWIKRPFGYVMVGLSGTFNNNFTVYKGRIDYSNCKEFYLERVQTNQITSTSTHIPKPEIVNKVPSSHDRTSLTVFYLNNSFSNSIKNNIEKIVYSGKYDNNNLVSPFLNTNFLRTNEVSYKPIQILNELNKLKVGKQILSKWYKRDVNGMMSLELVHQRGRFTATDQDYNIAQSLFRGKSALEDYGHRLVNHSYVLVIDITKLKRIYNVNFIRWESDVVGYIYKINFSETLQNAFYECWIYDDDPPNVRSEKNKKYESLTVPLLYEFQVKKEIFKDIYQIQTGTAENIRNTNAMYEALSLQKLIQDTYNEIIYLAETINDNFKAKVPLYSTKPLKAKIGLKEGLKTDDRYFVYEHSINKKTGKEVVKRKGVVRSTSRIADNRQEASGSMQMSNFYQVAGRPLKPGYILMQENDEGFEITVTRALGGIGGTHYRFDFRHGRSYGLRSTFSYLEFAFQRKSYNTAYSVLNLNNNMFTFFHLGLGLAKGFQITRNIELRPYSGIGWEYTYNKDLPEDYSVGGMYFRPGTNIAINVKHDIQLFGGWGYYFMLGWFFDEERNEVVPWESIFTDRKGGVYSVGLKFML